MSTVKAPSSIELLHRNLDMETLDCLEALAEKGYTLEAEESEFRFHFGGTRIGELLADPEEVAEAARRYQDGERPAPVTDPVNREEHEANLKERLVSLLGEKGVEYVDWPHGIVCDRGVFTFKCGADERTIYDVLRDAERARLLHSDIPQSYLLLCCVPVKDMDAVQRVAARSLAKVAEWEECDSFPFDMADLLPTLAETIIAEIEAVESIFGLFQLIRRHELLPILNGQPDPGKRMPLAKQFAIREVLGDVVEDFGDKGKRLVEIETRLAEMGVGVEGDETDRERYELSKERSRLFDREDAAAWPEFDGTEDSHKGDDNIPRPARDSEYWRMLAEEERTEIPLLSKNRSRKAAKEKVLLALEALADGFDRGELPESLFGLSAKAQVMLLLSGAEHLTGADFDKSLRATLGAAGIDTLERFETARADLNELNALWLCKLDDSHSKGEKVVHPQTAEAQGFDGDVADERKNIPETIPPPEVEIKDRTTYPVEELSLDKVRFDGGTQMRVGGLDEKTVGEYVDDMRAGDKFKPGVVFFDGADYWCAAGFHRSEAARRVGRTTFEFEIHSGDLRAAKLYAIRSNVSHGLRLKDGDKRHAVELMLNDPEWSKWSNREIGRQCGATHTFVGNIRKELSGHRSQIEAKATRGGTEYTINTANIGANQKPNADDGDSWLLPEHAAIPAEERARAFDEAVTSLKSPAETPPEANEGSHIQPEASTATATTEASLTESPVTASAGDTNLDSLVAALRAAGLNGLSRDELLESGFSHTLVEQAKLGEHAYTHVNQRILYWWKDADVVAAIRERGPLSRLDLEDLGCQPNAFISAKAGGLIRPGKGGKFEITGEAQATPVASPPAGSLHGQAEELTADEGTVSASQAPQPSEVGEFERADILLTVHLLPIQPGEAERKVKLGVRNDADPPLFSAAFERNWKGEASSLLDKLRKELPGRVAARAAKKVATPAASNAKSSAKPKAKTKPKAATKSKPAATKATTKAAAKTAPKGGKQTKSGSAARK